MSRKGILPQSSHHVMLFDEDWIFINEAFGPGSASKIGASAAIRALVHRWVGSIKAKALQAEDAAGETK